MQIGYIIIARWLSSVKACFFQVRKCIETWYKRRMVHWSIWRRAYGGKGRLKWLVFNHSSFSGVKTLILTQSVNKSLNLKLLSNANICILGSSCCQERDQDGVRRRWSCESSSRNDAGMLSFFRANFYCKNNCMILTLTIIFSLVYLSRDRCFFRPALAMWNTRRFPVPTTMILKR